MKKQAGAVLCQAQEKLELAKPALPSVLHLERHWGRLPLTSKLRSSSIYQYIDDFAFANKLRLFSGHLKIKVGLHLPENWGRLPCCQTIEVVFHFPENIRLFCIFPKICGGVGLIGTKTNLNPARASLLGLSLTIGQAQFMTSSSLGLTEEHICVCPWFCYT